MHYSLNYSEDNIHWEIKWRDEFNFYSIPSELIVLCLLATLRERSIWYGLCFAGGLEEMCLLSIF